jgi:hypothetical protein
VDNIVKIDRRGVLPLPQISLRTIECLQGGCVCVTHIVDLWETCGPFRPVGIHLLLIDSLTAREVKGAYIISVVSLRPF